MCISDNGQPRCDCGAVEQVESLKCELVDRNHVSDAAVVLVPDAGPVQGRLAISYSGDVDHRWYRFDAQPSVWYRADFTSTSLNDVVLGGDPGFVTADAGQSPWYYRSDSAASPLFALSSVTGEEGAYSIDLHVLGVDDFGEDAAHASPVAVGESIHGGLQAAPDVDAFALPATAGRVYEVRCAQSDGGVCPVSAAGDGADNHFVGNGGGSTFVIPGFTGTEVLSAGPSGTDLLTPYTLSVSDWGQDPGAISAAPVLPTDGGTDDVADVFPGYPFLFTYPATPPDVYWARSTGDGACQLDPEVYIPGDAGTATLKVTASTRGPCAIQVLDVGPDDYGNDANHATTIDAGVYTVNTQYPGDIDAFLFAAASGSGYSVQCSPDCEIDPDWGIYGTQPTWVRVPDGGLEFSGGSQTAGPTYYTHFQIDGGIGPHALSIAEIPDDYPSPVTIAAGDTLQGRVDYEQDVDTFYLSTAPDASYSVSFDAGSSAMVMTIGSNIYNSFTLRGGTATFVGDGGIRPIRVSYDFVQQSITGHGSAPYELSVTSP